MNFLSITFRSIHANVEKNSIKKGNKNRGNKLCVFCKTGVIGNIIWLLIFPRFSEVSDFQYEDEKLLIAKKIQWCYT